MKTNKLIVPLISSVLFAAVAHADTTLTITGSTAFRKTALDAIWNILDSGSGHFAGDPTNNFTTGGCIYGTIGGSAVDFQCTFSGSAQGSVDVYNAGNVITTTDKNGNVITAHPDIAFTDNWPAAEANPIANTAFDNNSNDKIGVNVFCIVANTNLYAVGVTNIDRERLKLLIDDNGSSSVNADGTGGGGANLPAHYIGANTNTGDYSTLNNTVYLLGRDIGSGTRITTFKTIGYTGILPVQWAVTNDVSNGGNGEFVRAQDIAGFTITYLGPQGHGTESGVFVKTNTTLGTFNNAAGQGFALDGFDSGGTLVGVLNNTPNTIGYAGYPDATSGSNFKQANLLTFEGVAPSPANVESGAYPFWSYEHLLSIGLGSGSSSPKAPIRAALYNLLTNDTFQNTDANYYNNGTSPKAARMLEMHVKRSVDGGPITPVSAAY
jgi:hypothetical protein